MNAKTYFEETVELSEFSEIEDGKAELMLMAKLHHIKETARTPITHIVVHGVYDFELLVHEGDTVNFRYSTTGGAINILRVQEIDAAMA